MKQSAVEWYAKQMQLKEQFTQEEFNDITNQAKEMEAEQKDYSEEDTKKNCKHNWVRENDSFNLKPYCKKCGIDC